MGSGSEARLVFMANPEIGIIVVRPIGYMTGPEFVERLFDAYAGVEAPWTFNRMTDFRRFQGRLNDDDLRAIRDRWQLLAGNRTYRAHVAVVSDNPLDQIRVPAASPMFSNETICLFTNFHEAMGWLQSTDRTAYLAALAPSSKPHSPDTGIVIG